MATAAEGLAMDNAAFFEKRAREAALGEAILAGTLTHAELKEERGIAITSAQDHVFQVGQGAIPYLPLNELQTRRTGGQ